MGERAFVMALLAMSLVGAFVISMIAELMLLPSEKRSLVAVGKSAKGIIIPSLIALYALVITEILRGNGG